MYKHKAYNDIEAKDSHLLTHHDNYIFVSTISETDDYQSPVHF